GPKVAIRLMAYQFRIGAMGVMTTGRAAGSAGATTVTGSGFNHSTMASSAVATTSRLVASARTIVHVASLAVLLSVAINASPAPRTSFLSCLTLESTISAAVIVALASSRLLSAVTAVATFVMTSMPAAGD